MNENRTVIIRGKEYALIHNDKTANFEKDVEKVRAILEKSNDELTALDRFALLQIYRPSFHKSGKIENAMSFDSTATNCDFCKLMREAAKENKLHICGYCYDYSQEHGFKGANVINRHTLNMIIMSEVEFTVDELRVLNVAYINRVNSSGDVPNVTYAKNMLKLCFAFPSVRFGFWAKNTAAVVAACDELGKPSNVKLIQSSPIIGKAVKLAPYFDVVFVVYLTKEATEKAIAAGAKECNGKKCKACGFKCYLENGWQPGDVVAEYLRIPGMRDADREKNIG